ncbi:HAD-IA family hydrolase, partial [Candidatus Micrarchaeota archaeon]|nr:HAD-IA family hydrolase [Candidatus Micrarchaeota archaeon]
MAIKHLLFDIDDTLFASSEFSALARKNAINAMIAMGLDYDYAFLNKKLSQIVLRKTSNYSYHFNDLCKELKVKNPSKFVAAAVAAYHDSKSAIQPFPEVPITLLKLKEKGYPLYIATTGNSVKQWDKLIRLKIALYFEEVFVSDQKNEQFYKKILKSLNTKPQNCMMIGDREDRDILPAKKLGIQTVRVFVGKYSRESVPSQADYKIKKIDELLSI